MVADPLLPDYRWTEQTPHTEAYLLAPLQQLLREFVPPACVASADGCPPSPSIRPLPIPLRSRSCICPPLVQL